MTIYISNVNGDWWEFDSRSPLFILDTDQLNQNDIDEIEEEWNGFENDKFEQAIQHYGNAVLIDELVSNNLVRENM